MTVVHINGRFSLFWEWIIVNTLSVIPYGDSGDLVSVYIVKTSSFKGFFNGAYFTYILSMLI